MRCVPTQAFRFHRLDTIAVSTSPFSRNRPKVFENIFEVRQRGPLLSVSIGPHQHKTTTSTRSSSLAQGNPAGRSNRCGIRRFGCGQSDCGSSLRERSVLHVPHWRGVARAQGPEVHDEKQQQQQPAIARRHDGARPARTQPAVGRTRIAPSVTRTSRFYTSQSAPLTSLI